MSSAERFVRHHQQQTDRAISQAFLRVRGAPSTWSSFETLLDVARRRAPGVLAAPLIDGRDHHGILALEQLARASERHVRPVATWPGSGAGWRGAVAALAQHVVGIYQVPAFLGSAWYASASERGDAQREWFIEHGAGRPFRSLDLPLAMTRRMEHLFLRSPAHLAVTHALRRAELLALGAEASFAELVLTARAAASFDHADFWRTAWIFLIANTGEIPPAQVAPLIDFFEAIRHERVTVETPTGVQERDPPEPDFSLDGRTAKSVLRLMQDWHRALGHTREVLAWAPSGLHPMRMETWPEDPEEPATTWEMVELTNASALRAETVALRHCVSIYARHCARGGARIWSLRKGRGDAPPRPVLTVQIDPKQRAIVQVRGYHNAWPTGRPLQIVRSWAARERVWVKRL